MNLATPNGASRAGVPPDASSRFVRRGASRGGAGVAGGAGSGGLRRNRSATHGPGVLQRRQRRGGRLAQPVAAHRRRYCTSGGRLLCLPVMDLRHPAKLTAPRVGSVFPRERLFAQLDAVRGGGNIVWIAAPAGAGKTTLVTSYLQARRAKAVWVRIDPADSDAASFFHDLAPAAAGGRRAPLPAFTAEYLGGLPAFARHWFRRFFSRLHGASVLVFDDYHLLDAASPVHLAMREALAEVPPALTVIVTSRTGPPPALTRLRTLDSFRLLDGEALRLSADECSAVVRQRLGDAGPDDASLQRLHERTQGWVAGLVLMLAHGKGAVQGDAPVDALVFDYFAGELMAQADPGLQRFLLRSALLPRFSSAAAARLGGREDAAELLAGLEQRNFFITRHVAAGQADSWAYHRLFREFLLARGRATLGAHELAQARRDAAALLAAEGDIAASIALLREAGDWPRLIAQVLEEAPALVRSGRFRTLAAWIEGIAPSQRASTPWLAYYHGVCRLPYDPVQARELLAQAFAGFERAGQATGGYLAWAAIVDTFVYAWSDFTPADRWIAAFDALRARAPEFACAAVELRAVAAIFAILIYRRPQHLDLPHWTQRLDALLAQDIDPALRMTAAAQLLLYYEWWVGDRSRARALVSRIAPFADARGVGPIVRLAWEGMLAASYWMDADCSAALAATERGLALAEETGAHSWDFMLVAQGAVAAATAGDADLSRRYLARLTASAGSERRLDAIQYHFFSYQEAMRRDDLPAMLAHGHAGLKSTQDAGVLWGEVYTRPALARALFLAGDTVAAQSQLDETARIASAIGCRNGWYYLHEIEAEFAAARADLPAERAALARLFAVMREQGFVNSAWWHEGRMARWCALALDSVIEVDFVRALIRRRGLKIDAPPVRLARWPWPVRVRCFGALEIERDGEPLRFAGKIPRRPLALLAALVAFGGSGVAVARLADALWPDAEGDAAQHAFVTALQRLRGLLGQRDALMLQDGRLSLDPRLCWVDALAFESVDIDDRSDGAAGDRERALALYRGPFLAHDDAGWALAARERLRSRFVRLGGADLQRHLDAGDWPGTIACAEQLLEADAGVELFYQQLMRAQLHLGRGPDVMASYRRCREALASTRGLRPSATTEALLDELAGISN